MGDRDVLIVLFEYEPEAATTALFKSTRAAPARSRPNDVRPDDAAARHRRARPGYQAFFNEAGRAFCLYVVLGQLGTRRAPLVQLVNSVLATVQIAPRAPS